VESILTGGSHLLELVNEILDLARIEADHITLALEDVNANEAAASCIALARPLGEQRNIKFIDTISDKSSPPLRTDLMRLKQALINLLSNAVKYNKDGGTVTIDGWETDDGFYHISVTDTGVGIAREDHHGVFKMFHRLGADPTNTREGTGIGLTVTKLLIERMAGRVGFESEKNVGSTFWIELPLVSNQKALIWTEALNIGVDSIDKDHQVIVALLNKVTHRIVDDAELVEILEKLIEYTHYHFRREEAVMKACGYPDIKEHKKIHRKLLRKINDLANMWHHTHDHETLRELRKFLRRWLFNHILKVDAEIAPYAQAKGLAIRKALEKIN
jgi:hemerythrin-like metal-binding protein